jgi:hypothetical protein
MVEPVWLVVVVVIVAAAVAVGVVIAVIFVKAEPIVDPPNDVRVIFFRGAVIFASRSIIIRIIVIASSSRIGMMTLSSVFFFPRAPNIPFHFFLAAAFVVVFFSKPLLHRSPEASTETIAAAATSTTATAR